MKYQYIRAFIVLSAVFVTLITNIKKGRDVTTSLLIVLVVLMIFYVLATLIVEILQKSIEKKEEADSENSEEMETDEELKIDPRTEGEEAYMPSEDEYEEDE